VGGETNLHVAYLNHPTVGEGSEKMRDACARADSPGVVDC
jgi:hypothetical protein